VGAGDAPIHYRKTLVRCHVTECMLGASQELVRNNPPSPMAAMIKTVILKEGMPSVEQARARLSSEIQNAQRSGIKVLKVVHGYGSTGAGGELRIALQSTLRQMAARREIRDCIFGENWRTSDERSWTALKQMPELKSDSDLGRANKGITIVFL